MTKPKKQNYSKKRRLARRSDLPIGRVVITKTSLGTLPEDARRIFLVAGHISNEVNTLHRLVIFSMRFGRGRVVDLVSLGRAWVIPRLLIGKTAEAYQFIGKRIRGQPFGKTYLDKLSPQGKESLKRLDLLLSSE
jgi:hypothetical protein